MRTDYEICEEKGVRNYSIACGLSYVVLIAGAIGLETDNFPIASTVAVGLAGLTLMVSPIILGKRLKNFPRPNERQSGLEN